MFSWTMVKMKPAWFTKPPQWAQEGLISFGWPDARCSPNACDLSWEMEITLLTQRQLMRSMQPAAAEGNGGGGVRRNMGFNYHHAPFVCAWYKESLITGPYRKFPLAQIHRGKRTRTFASSAVLFRFILTKRTFKEENLTLMSKGKCR